jgi:hypothetical protein
MSVLRRMGEMPGLRGLFTKSWIADIIYIQQVIMKGSITCKQRENI